MTRLTEAVTDTLIAWIAVLGSKRFMAVVALVILIVIWGPEKNGESVLSWQQVQAIAVVILGWMVGDSLRPHGGGSNEKAN